MGNKMKRWAVSYEGWVIVEAETQDEALDETNKLLEEWNVLNDGELGEWYLGDVDNA